MTIRRAIDDAALKAAGLTCLLEPEVLKAVDAVLDALIQRAPSVCPSGFDWTSADIEDWLRAVKEGRA